MAVSQRPDGTVDAQCSRCLCGSDIVANVDELVAKCWEPRGVQIWCPDCAIDARSPPLPFNKSYELRRMRRLDEAEREAERDAARTKKRR